MSYSIFYDLETSDLERVGQILNYAFVVVDEQFNEIDVLTETVRISRLQLPRVGAILANRTNVLEHQQIATQNESQAVANIDKFLRKWGSQNPDKKIPFIGFNSADFDFDFLRTTFIRNGRSPYAIGLISRDLLLVARHLMASHDDFRTKVFDYARAGEGTKTNLRLESLSKIFRLLDGEQLHESLFDVRLTVQLARQLKDCYGVDVRLFEPYQIRDIHSPRSGQVFTLREPLTRGFKEENRYTEYQATLLDADHRYALWIDLKKFAELTKSSKDPKKAIKWRKFAEHIVFSSDGVQQLEDQQIAAKDALTALTSINLKNYFEPTNCDIEQFIFRIHPSAIDSLFTAMNSGSIPLNSDNDFRQLCRRYWLENADLIDSSDFQESLRRYADYRYNGKLLLRSEQRDSEVSEPQEKKALHPTLSQLLAEVEFKLTDAQGEDRELVLALKEFYLNSEIAMALKVPAL